MPLVTILLVALNALGYSLELALGGYPACEAYGLVPAHPSLENALSALFLHDPSNLVHLGGNLVFLAVFGPIVERALGAFWFTGLYGAAGLGGATLHVLANAGSSTPLIGASGSLFGLLALAAVLRPRLLGFAVAFAGFEVWRALLGGSGETSFSCHIGGFAVGVLVAAFLRVIDSESLETA